MIKNEFSVMLGGRALTLYSIGFCTDTKVAETQTLSGGIYRRITGSRKNFYTLKGRMPFMSFVSFCEYVNELAASSLALEIDGQQIEGLVFTKGECTALEEGMCDYTLMLEEAEI